MKKHLFLYSLLVLFLGSCQPTTGLQKATASSSKTTTSTPPEVSNSITLIATQPCDQEGYDSRMKIAIYENAVEVANQILEIPCGIARELTQQEFMQYATNERPDGSTLPSVYEYLEASNQNDAVFKGIVENIYQTMLTLKGIKTEIGGNDKK